MPKEPKKAKAPKAEKPNPVVTTPEKGDVSRSVWSGTLSFGLINFPVKSYKATDEDKIERHMYHSADCMSRLNYQDMKCSGCQTIVNKNNAVYGVTVDGKTFLVSDEELASQKPTNDKVLNINTFVPAESIEPIYYESTEYLTCSAEAIQLQQAYASFRDALKLTGRVAIGRIVVRGHEYGVAIRPYGNGLMMSYLFAEYEVRNCGKFAAIEANPQYVQMLAKLFEASTATTFTAAPYDSYLKNVRTMIAKKAAGETVDCPAQSAEPNPTQDMIATLQAMLDAAKVKAATVGK